ncbi:hypothetical protein EDB85DRAFT_2143240 [Lactarius pseudohatsudake]|nr:hypothetical protein EDB85DRAFT_2143240 [Lactarius pseudohatsudake]
MAEELCEGLPTPFRKFVAYVRSLDFDTQPDYQYLHSILSQCSGGGTDHPGKALPSPTRFPIIDCTPVFSDRVLRSSTRMKILPSDSRDRPPAMHRKFISCSFASIIKELDGDHMIRGLVPTEDHLSVLVDVMDGVHMDRQRQPRHQTTSVSPPQASAVPHPYARKPTATVSKVQQLRRRLKTAAPAPATLPPLKTLSRHGRHPHLNVATPLPL